MVAHDMRTLLVLFVVGLVVGLAASTQIAAPAAERSADDVAATKTVATQEATACTPAPLEKRAAQTLVVGMPEVLEVTDPLAQELLDLGVGGVFVNEGNVATPEQVRTLTLAMRAASELPLLVTTDEETGRVSTFRSILGLTSSPRTVAAGRSPEEVREYAADLGRSLAELGLNSNLAPVADLDAGPSQGVIGDRSFSADPMTAAAYAQAFSEGLVDGGVLPTVKHFPGHGEAPDDVHRRSSTDDAPLDQLMSTGVQPFVTLVEGGAPIVMVGHVQYEALEPGRPASVSSVTYELLRELGFSGVAMTDSIGMGAIHRRWDFPRAAVLSVQAGADAVLATDGRHATAMTRALVRAVKRGRLDEARLNEAAARMLALKGVDPYPFTCTEVPPAPALAHRLPLADPGLVDAEEDAVEEDAVEEDLEGAAAP